MMEADTCVLQFIILDESHLTVTYILERDLIQKEKVRTDKCKYRRESAVFDVKALQIELPKRTAAGAQAAFEVAAVHNHSSKL